MKRVLLLFRLLTLALYLAAAPASALPTVYWDAANVGQGSSVSQAAANNAQAQGIPILTRPPGSVTLSQADSPEIEQALNTASIAFGTPTTFTSNWTAVNDTGTGLENLYLVFLHPGPHDIVLNGQTETVTYNPSEVGLTLGANWVIFQVEVGGNPVYYPAVSLGNLGADQNASFPLNYALNPPRLFSENFNFELGIPTWTVTFLSAPIPEPASGVLVLAGLLAIAVGRRKRC